MRFIDKFAKFTDYEGADFDLPPDIPAEYDFPADNSYTVQSRMNDMKDDDQPF